ncbi:MAG: RNA 2'-phosphotransferase [Syntrophaceticus sp.]
MNKKYIKLSKTVAHALRHAPQNYGLILDEKGWTDVENLIEGLKKHSQRFKNVTIDDLQKVINESHKKRFEIKDGKIRATYGHSLPSKIEKHPTAPPRFLYHGTTPRAAQNILETALEPRGRQYVHLSLDIKSAYEVGLRRTKDPVILKILAQKAYDSGINFYREKEGVWLSDSIPPEFITTL